MTVIPLPEFAKKEILYYFPKEDYEVFLVGGYIRDFIFQNKFSKDLDFAILKKHELPKEPFYVKDLFFSSPFWSEKIIKDDFVLHFSFFKKEIINSNFTFNYYLTANIYDDIYRRDLTFNSIYYDFYNEKIVDKFNILKSNPKIELISTNNLFTDSSRIIRIIKYAKLMNLEIQNEELKVLKKAFFYYKNYSIEFNASKYRYEKELKNVDIDIDDFFFNLINL